jgi:hypothetical protein
LFPAGFFLKGERRAGSYSDKQTAGSAEPGENTARENRRDRFVRKQRGRVRGQQEEHGEASLIATGKKVSGFFPGREFFPVTGSIVTGSVFFLS